MAPRAPSASAKEVGPLFAGQLNKPLSSISAADLADLVGRLGFTGGTERDRLCVDTPECDAGTARTSAHVEAVDQPLIAPNTIPANGVVVTRVANTGKFTERRYGLTAGSIAYLIAHPSEDSTAVGAWSLVQIVGNSTHVLASGLILACSHGIYSGKPQADFRTCASASDAHGKGMKINSASFHTGDDDPIWAECSTGCCIAGTRPTRPPGVALGSKPSPAGH
jgi:hypothetical protein